MPRKNLLTILLLVVLAMTIAHSMTTLRGQGQDSTNRKPRVQPSRDREGVDFESQFPLVDYDAPQLAEDSKKEERKNKSKRYDKYGLVSKHSSSDVKEKVRDIPWQERIAALPVGQSTAIVVGEILNAQAHLSNDKSGVYTEITVRVDEILKGDGSADLAVSNVISIDRPGGVVKYPNGHKQFYRIFGMNMPRVGLRYVLFPITPSKVRITAC